MRVSCLIGLRSKQASRKEGTFSSVEEEKAREIFLFSYTIFRLSVEVLFVYSSSAFSMILMIFFNISRENETSVNESGESWILENGKSGRSHVSRGT